MNSIPLVAAILLAGFGGTPPSMSLAHSPVRICHRYSSASDVDARTVARTAEVAAETLATERGGSYRSVSPADLHRSEPSLLPINRREALKDHLGAYLLSASGTTDSYTLTTLALNGDTYTITRGRRGSVKRRAVVCGQMRSW